jgi:hypothetical protein
MMSCATWRTPGNAAAQQTLFVLFNAGANRVALVRRVVLQADATAAETAIMPFFKLCRISTYSGGQALLKERWTATASHADIQARGRNTSDAGAQTNIVATPGDTIWQQFATRMATVVGQVVGDDNNVAPLAILADPIVLRQNQGILVYVDAVAGLSNPTTNHYFVMCAWSEVSQWP